MKISLIAIGKKMPNWVNTAFNDYVSRLPRDFSLQLIEVASHKRTKKADTNKILQVEGQLLINSVAPNNKVIALDRQGLTLSTETFTDHLNSFYEQSQDISILVGGPEGICTSVLQKSDGLWSLSALTLPHPLVRVMIAEQVFRAWSLLNNHPYHRF